MFLYYDAINNTELLTSQNVQIQLFLDSCTSFDLSIYMCFDNEP